MERNRELDLRFAALEVIEVRRGPQRTIDAGRADLERVRLRNRILDVENRRQLARDVLAVFEVDAVARNLAEVRDIGERQVDLHAQHPAALLEHEAQVDELEPAG